MHTQKISCVSLLLFVLAVSFFSVTTTTPLRAVATSDTLAQVSNDNSSSGLSGDGDLTLQGGVNAARGDGQPAELFGDSSIVSTITDTLLFIIGALSVVMIIFGGLRYVTSGGNASSVTAAKNTILYAIVGLIIAFLAYAAINFILGSVSTGITGGSL